MKRHPHAERVEAVQAAGVDPELRSLIDAMKGQLLIVLVNRLGGKIEVPVADVDATGAWVLKLGCDPECGVFTFQTERKQ